MMVKVVRLLFMVVVVFAPWLCPPVHGRVEMSAQRHLDVTEGIRDVAVSHNGKWIYVLTPKGEVLIYSGSGQFDDRIEVGKAVDSIQVGPTEETLVLTSSTENRIRIMLLDFIKKINIAGSPFKGREDAPVVITVFSEFQCPYCATLAPVLDQVLQKHQGRVKIVFKNFPLRNHSFAMAASAAAMAGHKQGRFWEFHDRLFEKVDRLSMETIQETASQMGLDMERFRKDMQSEEVMKSIRQDMSDGGQAGVAGTPSIFVNGRPLRDRTIQGFDSAIAKEEKTLRGNSSVETENGLRR
jgi:thiol-disulfide isomerase/thioredoxin